MNPRERIMAIVLGGAVGLFVVYQGFNFIFINPLVDARAELSDLERENDRLDTLIRSRRNLAQRWLGMSTRTLSYERPEATNRFGRNLKEIAKKHSFEDALFSPTSGSRLGRTGIATVAYRVVAQGRYPRALAFLQELYRTPYISSITKLSLAPQLQRGLAPDEIKLEFTIETPLLPRIGPDKIREVASAEAMTPEDIAQLDAVREDLRPPEEFAVLLSRDIFKPYVPPPVNMIVLDNQDWKTVAVRMQFYWEDKPSDQLVEAVPARSQKSVSGKGGVVEISGAYADGAALAAETLDFSTKKDWTYKIAEHHPPPEPEEVDLAVNNQDKIMASFEVALALKDGTTKQYPSMQIAAGATLDVDRFKVKSLTVAGKYASGKPVPPQTFTPAKTKQTYTIPPEPVELVAVPVDTSDPPPDPQYTVTGLLTYRHEQEMVVSGAGGRVVIPVGQEAAIDGGVLRGVHPEGGVVMMPSGNYYLYPLGRKYVERVRLEARTEAELPTAIDEWMKKDATERREPAATPTPTAAIAAPGAGNAPRKPGQRPVPPRPGNRRPPNPKR